MIGQLLNTCSRLKLADIQNVVAIPTPDDVDWNKRLNGNSVGLGIMPQHAVEPLSDRLAQALLVAEQAIWNDDFIFLLGDSSSYNQRFALRLQVAYETGSVAVVFGHQVNDRSAFIVRQGSHDYSVR